MRKLSKTYQAIFISLAIWVVPFLLANIINISATILVVWIILCFDIDQNIDKFRIGLELFKSKLMGRMNIDLIRSSIINNFSKEYPKLMNKTPETPPDDGLRKITVKELKNICNYKKISLPREGTGKNGSLIKKDIILAITKHNQI